MIAPYVVEEHDGKFWVHKQRRIDKNSGTVMGELAWKDPFDTRQEALIKAVQLEDETGCLF